MKITAALVWFDERPKDLEDCVRGIGEVADRIVAVDGAYRRYPDAAISSPPEQAERIRAVAAEMGMECVIHVPDRLWLGQVEKRTFLLQEASKDTDWIAIVDTDWVAHGDADVVRAELESLGPDWDVVSVPFYTPVGKTYATNWHRQVAGSRERMPHFFRPLEDIRVETLHWYYSARKGRQKVWLWHGDATTPYTILPQYPLNAYYGIEHRTLQRDERHILAGRAFCNDRVMVLAKTGQEDHVEGLPEPVFDFVTVPY